MRMNRLRVNNFKGLRELDIPVSSFVCLIGENNAGKSSVLQAVSLFFSGTVLSKTHYFDPDSPVRIELDFEDIADGDLQRLAEEHREKIRNIVKAGCLTLARIYGQEGKSTLKYRTRMPSEARFADESLSQLLKGKRPGQPFVTAVTEIFPELQGQMALTSNQAEVKQLIQNLADSLPDEQKVDSYSDLPTGIDKSISGLLPDPIYIPAVKDLKDDVKTSESTPFGKVLGILLKAIEPHLSEEQSLFEKLNAKLNCVVSDDGTETDERLAPVKTIEQAVEKHVQDSFRSVKVRIKIPPPELKTVLSSALIYANDGVDGLIDTKGDGLRRAIVFAILRSYVELAKSGVLFSEVQEDQAQAAPTHLLLFEEPELYLHPKAQQILFNALGQFSQRHPVFVTTHSPAFFGPHTTSTFIKMAKKHDATVANRPFGAAHPIDLGDTSARDQFQIICYENNNIAFFADTIVLVEGDSDFIVLPHLAQILNPAWDCTQLPVRFARIGGKGNIRRYRQFFARFQMRVAVVTDLDFILGSEFSQIDPSPDLRAARDELLAALDREIEGTGTVVEPTERETRAANGRGDIRALWREVKTQKAEFEAGRVEWSAVENAIETFFAWEKYSARKELLRECPSAEILAKKRSLLSALRKQHVCVLEKGAIEDYYPHGITGDGKPSKAQCFCNTVKTRDAGIELCAADCEIVAGVPKSEFDLIFETVFGR